MLQPRRPHPTSRRRTAAPVVASLGLAMLLVSLPAAAQQASPAELQQRLERLEQQLQRLGLAAGGEAGAAGALTPTQAAQFQMRLVTFENQLQQLTGQIEELGFKLRQMNQRLEQLVADVDTRLQSLEQAPPAVADAPAPSGAAPATAPGVDTGPRVIGRVAESDVAALQAAPVDQAGVVAAPAEPAATALQGETPKEQYDFAFSLLRKADWPQAEAALTAFLDRHPSDPLAGNAMYWLGETYYVRQDYERAAITFAEGFETYPESSKAPDNLLKLGMALASLNRNQDACDTFLALLERYRDAAATILQRAQRERGRLACQ